MIRKKNICFSAFDQLLILLILHALLILFFFKQGTHQQILDFVKNKYGAEEKITFFEKNDVNGKNTREVFSFLKQALPNGDGSTDVRWNFVKFLLDHEGTPIKRYAPKDNPYEKMKDDIEELLDKKEAQESKL